MWSSQSSPKKYNELLTQEKSSLYPFSFAMHNVSHKKGVEKVSLQKEKIEICHSPWNRRNITENKETCQASPDKSNS
jgi:hypothetical protein